MAKYYVADFEIDESEARVNKWGLCEVGKEEKTYTEGEGVETFIEEVMKVAGTIFIHDAKIESAFIFDKLLNDGFVYVNSRNPMRDEFSCLVSETGVFYNLTLCTYQGHAKITDSSKLIQANIDELRVGFGIEEEKSLKGDIFVVSKVIKALHEAGLKKGTAASCAMADFKKRCKDFSKLFPKISSECDADLRKCYRGGWCWTNPLFKGQIVGSGKTFDVNGLYPYLMKEALLPVGLPAFFAGKYKKNDKFPLFVQHISCEFRLKKGKFPMVQIKYSSMFDATEYLCTSGGAEVDLYFTDSELELFLENYETYNLQYIDGYAFQAKRGVFDEYIDYWATVKEEAGRNGNKALRQCAKIMLNGLGGRFGQKLERTRKVPVLKNGVVDFQKEAAEECEGVYLPTILFITALGRAFTVRHAQEVGIERFLYSDTDSISALDGNFDGFKTDNYKLGFWKLENEFTRAKFLHAKCYIKEVNDKIECKIAGMPDEIHEQVTFENFEFGAKYDGKKVPKRVEGGLIYESISFQIQNL